MLQGNVTWHNDDDDDARRGTTIHGMRVLDSFLIPIE